MNRVSELPYNDCVRDKLNVLVSAVTKNIADVERIVLFGSYARAGHRAGSDFDLLVLTSKQTSRMQQADLRSSFENVDFVFYVTELFEKSDCLLVKNIRRDGVLLWER